MRDIEFASAVDEWVEELGPASIRIDEKIPTTLPSSHQPLAVLRPDSVDQVAAVLRIASRHGIPVYPFSRGRNWGYGCAAPTAENCVAIDLSRMNRIVEINARLAYAVVEPGVTQQQMYDALRESGLQMDVTGGPPDASVLGNILERGYGLTPYSDHFLNSCGMEVVLADGTIVKTGFGHFKNARTGPLYKWGVGPYLDGLFTQSNFGIVTKVGVWLKPQPEEFGVFFFPIENDEQLGETVERLRDLRLRGTLTSAAHIFNDVRVLSSMQQYPWEEARGKTPLPADVLEALRRKHRVAPWTCTGGIQGARREVRAVLGSVRKAFRGVARVRFVSERAARRALRFAGLLRWLTGVDIEKRMTVLGLFKGVPTERPSVLPYWRKRTPAPASGFNPPRDGCGLIWCGPILPATREDAIRFVRMTRAIFDRHGFEANVSLNLPAERALGAVVGIVFDKENEQEKQSAAACHQALLKAYMGAGYIPYRLASDAMDAVVSKDPFWDVCSRIKEALDPEGILSPGRYEANKALNGKAH